jgi:hypothetical protein
MERWNGLEAFYCFLNFSGAIWQLLREIPSVRLAPLLANELLLYERERWIESGVASTAPAQQKLHPIDGVDHKPGGLLPLSEVFQEASDWPFTVEVPLMRAVLLVLNKIF